MSPESHSSCSLSGVPFGRQGIGVVQPISGVDFPLVQPSDDVAYLLADFWLAYDDPADYGEAAAFKPPFRIAWLYGFGCDAVAPPAGYPDPTHDVDLVVVDADGRTVFDSTTADEFTSRAWTDRLRIYSWQTDDAVCRVVVHTAWEEGDDAGRTYDLYIEPGNAVLDERTIERRPKRVKSLTVLTVGMTKTRIDWQAGYNMQLDHQPLLRGRRLVQQITFAAGSGLGLGIFPGCTPPPLLIRSIRGVRPNDVGQFYLAASECYYVRQPTTVTQVSPRVVTPTVSMLTLGNDCAPCCSCEDYVSAAEYLNSVGAQYHGLGVEAERIRDLYHENKDRWDAAAACFARKPLRLVLQPQYCPTMDVAAQFCNTSDECVGPLFMTIDFSTTLGTATSIPGYATITGAIREAGRRAGKTERYDLIGSWPVFNAVFDSVNPQQSVSVKFRLKFTDPCVGSEPSATVLVNATLTAAIGDEALPLAVDGTPVSVSASEALDCPPTYARVDPTQCCPDE